MFTKSSLKYSLLSFDELVINLDRLSRFKLPEESFSRVFGDIIFKHLIYPKYSKKEFQEEDVKYISRIVKIIWNDSVKQCFGSKDSNFLPNRALKYSILHTFKNIDEKTICLIDTKLNISPVLHKIDYKSASLNLKFLIKSNNLLDKFNYQEIREKFSLCFPISKLLIVEGITEEILLPVFAKLLNLDFNRHGIFTLGAGGKSKSPSIYMNLKEKLKIPVIMLFDEDAKEICEHLSNNLLKKDKYILIKQGEFEDILPINLIKRSLNKEYQLTESVKTSELKEQNKMCNNITNFYRTRKLGEFKKSKFAKIIAQNIKYNTDITEEIKKIINEII